MDEIYIGNRETVTSTFGLVEQKYSVISLSTVYYISVISKLIQPFIQSFNQNTYGAVEFGR